MSTQRARVAVVGTGWWSTFAHIPGLHANPDAELVALCDKRPDALQTAAASVGGVKTYTDYQQMLAKETLDGVVVCVNHNAHYEVAKACLETGIPVMLDKPMVLEAKHAHELEQLAKTRGVELIIGYPWHYTDVTRRARDIIQSGELGPIQYVSSLFTSMVIEFYRGNDAAYGRHFNYPITGPGNAYANPKLSGGGQGHLQVTHSAGSMFFVTGLQADTVTSFMENFDVAVDVADAIAVRFKPVNGKPSIGVLGSTGNLGVGDPGIFEVQVYCENGWLKLEQIQSTLYIHKTDGTERRYGPLPEADRYPRFAPSQNLVEVILGKGKNQSPADVGVRVVELLDAAYRSAAADGKPFRIADL
jgi:predicted dehydrogenase